MSFSSGAAAVLPALTAPLELQNISIEIPTEVNSEDYMPITDSKNVEKFIDDYFADIPVLAEIAKCESRFRQYNSKGEILKGKVNTYDRGVMQINILYHGKAAEKMGLDLHDIDDNVAYARALYEKEGSKPWMSSSPCWAKFSQSEIARK